MTLSGQLGKVYVITIFIRFLVAIFGQLYLVVVTMEVIETSGT